MKRPRKAGWPAWYRPKRAPYIIVRPESKLWAGVYQCWHHADKGRRMMGEPSGWFVVPLNERTRARFVTAEGWLHWAAPHRMRRSSKNGFYGEKGRMTRGH